MNFQVSLESVRKASQSVTSQAEQVFAATRPDSNLPSNILTTHGIINSPVAEAIAQYQESATAYVDSLVRDINDTSDALKKAAQNFEATETQSGTDLANS